MHELLLIPCLYYNYHEWNMLTKLEFSFINENYLFNSRLHKELKHIILFRLTLEKCSADNDFSICHKY